MTKELVQDRVIKYLTENLYVPLDMIDTNVPLAEFAEGMEGEIDVLVNVVDEEGYYAPVMVVQCLDEDAPMEGDALEKHIERLEEIDDVTLSGRVVLTNGDQMMYADWRGEENEEKDLPEYEVMVQEFKAMEEEVKAHEAEHAADCDCGCHDHDCDCGHDHK